MLRIVLSRRAERDLRRIGRGEALVRVREALEALAVEEPNFDVKLLAGFPPWHRLRVGDYRILYRRTGCQSGWFKPQMRGTSPLGSLASDEPSRRTDQVPSSPRQNTSSPSGDQWGREPSSPSLR